MARATALRLGRSGPVGQRTGTVSGHTEAHKGPGATPAGLLGRAVRPFRPPWPARLPLTMFKAHEDSAPCHPQRSVGGTTVVALRGEIDLCTGPPLSARLDTLTAAPFPDLVLDLRQVSFIDCSGLRTLCRARNRVRARGGRLRLVTESPRLLRVLRHTDLGGVFEVLPRPPEDGLGELRERTALEPVAVG